MLIELQLWQLISLLLAFFSCVAVFGKLLLNQFDRRLGERFKAQEKAQQKDYSEVDRLLALLQDPYSEQPGMDAYAAAPPNWGKHLSVSCSS